jgi:hypothetical protein
MIINSTCPSPKPWKLESYIKPHICKLITTMAKDLPDPSAFTVIGSTQLWSNHDLVNTDETDRPEISHILPWSPADTRSPVRAVQISNAHSRLSSQVEFRDRPPMG